MLPKPSEGNTVVQMELWGIAIASAEVLLFQVAAVGKTSIAWTAFVFTVAVEVWGIATLTSAAWTVFVFTVAVEVWGIATFTSIA